MGDIMGFIADTLGIIGAITATFAWYQTRKLREETRQEQARQDQSITIEIREQNGTRYIPVPGTLRRRDFVRSEVLGYVGMLPLAKPPGRFHFAYLSDNAFSQELLRIQNATQPETLVIYASADELSQFRADLIHTS